MSADAASTRGLPVTTPTTSAFGLARTIDLVTIPQTPQTVTCQPPCQCMERARAIAAWGPDGFTWCDELPCGYSSPAAGLPIEKYCYNQKIVTIAGRVSNLPTVTPTYLQIVTIPLVTETTATPTHVVTVNPNLVCAADDKDCDGHPVAADNCPTVANMLQTDSDKFILWSTCQGTACKLPSASDLSNCEGPAGSPLYENCVKAAWQKANPGSSCTSNLNCQYSTDKVGDACDTCREVQNPDQADTDHDCDSFKNHPSFWDGTQWLRDPQCGDACDKCPGSDDSKDADQDSVPDACDKCPGSDDKKDADHDSIPDACDNCPQRANADQKDTDQNGAGDMCQDPCTMNLNAVQNFSWTEWRGINWMTPVRDQAGCGSCWAFSTVGATEGIHNIEHGKQMNLNLAEQELVSPCYGGGDAGSCTGGWYSKAIGYVTSNGLVNENSYPYLSVDEVVDDPNGHLACKVAKGHCSTPATCVDSGLSPARWRLSSSGSVGGTVQDVKQALLCHGPLVVASDSWWHAIVLTGWDDTTGKWHVRNSWGSSPNWSGYNEIAYTGEVHSDIINRVAWVQGVTGP